VDKTVGELTTEDFEKLVVRTIDRRLEVWLTQLTDALIGLQDEEDAESRSEFRPEFTAALRRSLEQASSGQTMDLQAFRDQIGR